MATSISTGRGYIIVKAKPELLTATEATYMPRSKRQPKPSIQPLITSIRLPSTGRTGIRVLGRIPISLVEMDRYPFDRVLGLVEHLKQGGTVPPIHVEVTHQGRYRILDGRHRVHAAKLLGRDVILAKWGVQV